jgi:tRNA A22 N-methylase
MKMAVDIRKNPMNLSKTNIDSNSHRNRLTSVSLVNLPQLEEEDSIEPVSET